MNPTDQNYLRRALQRQLDKLGESSSELVSAIFRQNNADGLLNSGNTLLETNKAVTERYEEVVQAMAGFLFETEATSEDQLQLLMEYAHKAIAIASTPVREGYQHTLTKGLSGINLRMGNELVEKLTDKRLEIIDDYRNGILKGRKIVKDPNISIINNITNSPGTILQSGIGNLTQSINQQDANVFFESLKKFENSSELQHLCEADRTALLDIVDTLRDQVKKQPPDPERIRRWLNTLSGVATDFGVQVAAGGVLAAGLRMLSLS